MGESRGTRIAREGRTICNKMADVERSSATERAMRIIYGGNSTYEAFRRSLKKYGPAYKRLA